MILKQKIKKIVLKSCRFVKDIKAVALYGSSTYKNEPDVKDYDAFVVFGDNNLLSGRLSVYVNSIKKNVNIYLIKETDFFDDVLKQKFGSKLTLFFFHGYLPLYNPKACFKYYVESINSLINHFDFPIEPCPEKFFKKANLALIKIFPSFIKSSLDFYTYPLLCKNNYRIYKKAYPLFSHINKQYSSDINYIYTAKLFTAFFRKKANQTITNLKAKQNTILQRLAEGKDLFIKNYGTFEYEIVVKNTNNYFKTIQTLMDNDDFKILPLYIYPIINMD